MEQNKSEHVGTGYLIVRATTAGGAIPLEGATVKIWTDAASADNTDAAGDTPRRSGDVYRILLTDRDGNTDRIPLAAPPREVSFTPGGVPYEFYHIDVSFSGFYPQEFIRVPIYDGITSIQNAYLIPLPEGSIQDGDAPLGERVEEGVNPLL